MDCVQWFPKWTGRLLSAIQLKLMQIRISNQGREDPLLTVGASKGYKVSVLCAFIDRYIYLLESLFHTSSPLSGVILFFTRNRKLKQQIAKFLLFKKIFHSKHIFYTSLIKHD